MRKLICLLMSLALLSCSSNESPDNTMNVDDTLVVDNLSADMNATDMNATDGNPVTPPPPNPNEVIYCARVMREARRSECEVFERAWRNLEEGSGAVAAPSSMVRGETVKISFAVSADAEGNKGQPVAEELLGQETTQRVTLQVGARMAAQLTGEGFKIEPSEPVERQLGVTRGALWEWDVTALKARRHLLLIRVFVRVKDTDGEQTRLLKSREIPITVRVTTGQTIGDYLDDSQAWLGRGTNWLKALTAFIAAVAGVTLAARQLRSGRTKDAQ